MVNTAEQTEHAHTCGCVLDPPPVRFSGFGGRKRGGLKLSIGIGVQETPGTCASCIVSSKATY
jgi:hypothetical protein